MNIRSETTAARSSLPLILLYAISGFCALTLETVWMREISLRAGNTVVAATLVIVVFFAAAALGNLLGARLVAYTQRPLSLYGRFEAASGTVAAITFGLGHWIWSSASAWPSGWLGQIAATLLLVGPPSFLSGVSFPCLAEAFVTAPHRRTETGGLFYGANLLGAAVGVLAGSVLLPWWLGVRLSFATASVIQILAGVIAWRLVSAYPARGPAAVEKKKSRAKREEVETLPAWLGCTVLAASGVLSLSSQSLLIMWARQVLEGSVYAIAGVLSAFIGGLGLGAFAASALRRRGRSSVSLLAMFGALSALALFAVPTAGEWLVSRRVELHNFTPPGMLIEALGYSLLWLLPLTTCLGGVFPVAWELARASTTHEGTVLGGALSLNKMGSAAGIACGLFVLVPGLGLAAGTCGLAWGYLLLVATVVWFGNRSRAEAWLPAVAVAVVGIWQTVRAHPPMGLFATENVIAAYSGPYGPIAVVENRETGSRQILLNSRQRLSGTGRALASQHHQSWVPLLFCQKPERVMTIGMASGISAAAALDFPVKELLAVELVPDVVRAAREHFANWNARLFSDPRGHVAIGDGRVVLSRETGKFDAVICDLFFPNEDGTANLYSREFFQSVRAHLNRDGVFCLWLPCFQHEAESAGVVIRTFLEEFPHAIAVRSNLDPLQPVIGLVGSNELLPMSREFLEKRLASAEIKKVAEQSPFLRSADTAWLLLAGDLRPAQPGFGEFPVTSDDRPLFAFIGPREPQPAKRLIGMTFLNWIGKRFSMASYPSCDLGGTSAEEVHGAVRAANFYFAAAIAQSVIPGDKRPETVRLRQVMEYLAKARELSPKAEISSEALGR